MILRYFALFVLIFFTSLVSANPVVSWGKSTGDDGYMVHLHGTGFQTDSYVDVRKSTADPTILQHYTGSFVHVVGTTDIYITITDATQRNLFYTNGLYFWIVNPTPTGSWTSPQYVKWVSPPPPHLISGQSTGSDGYTIHLTGEYFHSTSSVDVRTSSSSAVIANYAGSQVTITNDSDITFYVNDATQRSYLNTTGLYFWVVNLTPTATWDGPAQVIRVARDTSNYDSVSSAVTVSGVQTILQRTLALSSPKWLFLSSDGNVTPSSSSTATSFSAAIYLDNIQVSDSATIAWGSTPRDTHGFNAIAAQYVPAGTHVIKLVGTTSGSSASVGVGSNLSTMLSPATTVIDNRSGADVGPINFNTYAQATGADDRSPNPAPHPYTPVITNSLPLAAGQPLVVFGSGTHFQAGHDGDSAIGIWVDGAQANSYQASWASNDICLCAEQRAPYYLRGLLTSLSAATHNVVLGASELYWSDQNTDNPIIYKVAANSHLITMSGGIHTSGVLYSPTALPNAPTSMLNTIPITVASPAVIASGTINVPTTSNGVLFFSASTRQFGGAGNATITLQIKIDGAYVGSQGKQTCAYTSGGTCVSTRTLTASYLASGTKALSPGTHTIQAVATMQSGTAGQKMYVSVDAPLIWFD